MIDEPAMRDPTHRLPVTVIGGYLGAGKTTLLNHLLRRVDGQRLAVLVNDFGAIAVDASLIRARDGDTIELTNGCICCSLADGFAQAMYRIDELVLRPERVVIETSGIADPGAVAQYAHLPGFRLDAVLVMVDAETVRTRVDDALVGRLVRRQLAAADVLVVNKVDLVSDAQLASLLDWARAAAPSASQVTAVDGAVSDAVLFGTTLVPRPTEADAGSAHDPQHGHGDAHRNWTVWPDATEPVDLVRLRGALDALPAEIVRVKGFVTTHPDGERRLVQRVGRRLAITRESATGTADALVLIAIDRPDAPQTPRSGSDLDEAVTGFADALGARLEPPGSLWLDTTEEQP